MSNAGESINYGNGLKFVWGAVSLRHQTRYWILEAINTRLYLRFGAYGTMRTGRKMCFAISKRKIKTWHLASLLALENLKKKHNVEAASMFHLKVKRKCISAELQTISQKQKQKETRFTRRSKINVLQKSFGSPFKYLLTTMYVTPIYRGEQAFQLLQWWLFGSFRNGGGLNNEIYLTHRHTHILAEYSFAHTLKGLSGLT